MNTPLSGPRAYSPAAQSPLPGAVSRRPADKAGAEFTLDLDQAVTPAEWKALAETFGAPAASSSSSASSVSSETTTQKASTGETRGRHIDIRA